MKTKKQIREHFRAVVFTRDNFKCVFCGKPAVDAHHITDRNELKYGGYVLQNGISLCEDDHKKAEKYHETNGEEWVEGFHPDDLYKKIKSSKELAIKYDLISLSL
jgi:5-methylcytosine-specific restriction endonuclease McrA